MDPDEIRADLMRLQPSARKEFDDMIDWLGEYRDLTMIGDPIGRVRGLSDEDFARYHHMAQEAKAMIALINMTVMMEAMLRSVRPKKEPWQE